MTGFIPSLDAAKAQAKALRAVLSAEGREIGHSAALELIAKSLGHKDWNTLHAAIGNGARAPVHLGQIVPGRYLKQDFVAKIIGIRELSEGRYEVTLQFDKPVDVVTFDSFSNFRSRVHKIVGPDGRSFDKTSDGQPHLVLWG
ncbi:MAG: glyoxalase superfamily protein [Cypionkella sp.]